MPHEPTFAVAWEDGKTLAPAELRTLAMVLDAEGAVTPIAATVPYTR